MGTDKALLKIGSVTMLDRTVATLREVVDPVYVVGGGHDAAGAHYIEDLFPGEGPVGAVISALGESDSDVLVVTSCDLPALRSETLRVLVEALRASGADYAVPIAHGRRQWHCLGLRRSCHDPIVKAFDQGARSYRDAVAGLSECGVLIARPDDFADIDTPEQFHQFRDGARPG